MQMLCKKNETGSSTGQYSFPHFSMTTLYAMHFGTFFLGELEDDGLDDFKGGDDADTEEALSKVSAENATHKHAHGEPSQSDIRGVGADSGSDED